jgi:hypothetical protein
MLWLLLLFGLDILSPFIHTCEGSLPSQLYCSTMATWFEEGNIGTSLITLGNINCYIQCALHKCLPFWRRNNLMVTFSLLVCFLFGMDCNGIVLGFNHFLLFS